SIGRRASLPAWKRRWCVMKAGSNSSGNAKPNGKSRVLKPCKTNPETPKREEPKHETQRPRAVAHCQDRSTCSTARFWLSRKRRPQAVGDARISNGRTDQMALEIERKFLVISDAWRKDVYLREAIRQAYLAQTDALSVRVRIVDDQAFLTIKTKRVGI